MRDFEKAAWSRLCIYSIPHFAVNLKPYVSLPFHSLSLPSLMP